MSYDGEWNDQSDTFKSIEQQKEQEMRNLKRCLPLLVLFVLFGCSGSAKPASTGDTVSTAPSAPLAKTVVTIKIYNAEPESMKAAGVITIKGRSEGQFVEFAVSGEVKDVELISLEWDDVQNNLKEKATLQKLVSVAGSIVIVKTILAEGIPSEKIKWKSTSGKVYEFLLQEDGTGEVTANGGTVFELE